MTEQELIEQAQEIYGETVRIETLLDACEAFYMAGSPDEQSGDVEAPTGHFYRIDKWIVFTDSAGFKTVRDFMSEGMAELEFTELEAEYAEWCEDDDSDY